MVALSSGCCWGVALSDAAEPPPGAVGLTAEDADDAGDTPMEFVAVTVNVYVVPGVRPVTEQVVAPVVVQVAPPGLAVTV